MKSPLVEALRQANGGIPEPEPPAQPASPVADEQPVPDPGELQLLDATDVLQIAGGDRLPIDGIGETANDAMDADFDDREPGGHRRFAGAVNATAAHRLWIRRVGLYSPVICLLLAAVTSGIYFACLALGGLNQNTGLHALSSQRGSTAATSQADSSTAGAESPFKLRIRPAPTASDSTTDDPHR